MSLCPPSNALPNSTFAAMNASDHQALIDHAVAAAFDAGKEILDVYAKSINVEMKEDKSPLTEADKRAHAAITARLKATGLPVVSEEGKNLDASERQAWPLYWLVDPLDGTKEFIKRNGEFTVNIALVQRQADGNGTGGYGKPVGGVIYVPVMDRLYMAWQGGGAYRLDGARSAAGSSSAQRVTAAQRLPMPKQGESFTIVASRSHNTPETEAFIEQKRKEHGNVALVSMGSALKICLVAEGAADVYPRYAPTMEWDTAAGHAIASEAGKQLVDMTTRVDMRYNKDNLLNNWFSVQ
jgi:3'(2'), 5'-bisphosphate nucleotidase